MFEEALLSAPLPGIGPASEGQCVAPDPCDVIDPDLDAQLDQLAAGYAAVPAAAVFPPDADELPPGPELAAMVARFDPAHAEAGDLLEVAAALGRLEAWTEGLQAAVSAALASRAEMRPDQTGYRSANPVTNTAVAVAGRRHLTARQAENLVGHSLQLVEDFPDTHACLSAGLIDLRRARVITDELGGQDPAVRERVEAAVLPKAPHLDSVALRALIKRLLHELAPVETAERHRRARDRRYVAVTPASDGMSFVEALMPAEDATAIDTALNVAAADAKRADAAAGRPARTRDQRRADALADLGWEALTACADAATRPTPDPTPGQTAAAATSSGPPERATAVTTGPRRRPISVHVTIPFTALCGLTDEPGELDGYGPIPAHVARALAAEGVWTWLSTDPGTGQLLDLGRRKYRPTKALADFITARDRTCRAPGCHRAARSCDIDHIVSFAAGGATSAANCHALCETHHLLKHHAKWAVERQPDGTTRWRSPTGHHFLKPPARAG
ncbi:HNH endonuclease signature motif containing protein [Jiangella alkaliphila]|uniref:HNH endonuclease signature motif containing protein n=3 Tax=Jiangella alkaliphila TaxID=419479 RepID=UPI0009F65CE8|nr:HNH endonuclease signature motif containing protein [Jiangella alkaliphila]